MTEHSSPNGANSSPRVRTPRPRQRPGAHEATAARARPQPHPQRGGVLAPSTQFDSASSVQLRSALVQALRSARESITTCQGDLSAYRSTGHINSRVDKPPAYCGRRIAPMTLIMIRGIYYSLRIGSDRSATVSLRIGSNRSATRRWRHPY